MIYIKELDITVSDKLHYIDAAADILTAFCDAMENDENTREVDDDERDLYEGFSFIWMPHASKLIREKKNELLGIGVKYFGVDEIKDIHTHMFREPY